MRQFTIRLETGQVFTQYSLNGLSAGYNDVVLSHGECYPAPSGIQSDLIAFVEIPPKPEPKALPEWQERYLVRNTSPAREYHKTLLDAYPEPYDDGDREIWI